MNQTSVLGWLWASQISKHTNLHRAGSWGLMRSQGTIFKTISENFSETLGSLPSDFVLVSKATERSVFGVRRFQDAVIKRSDVQ